jgi:hypothetical protein
MKRFSMFKWEEKAALLLLDNKQLISFKDYLDDWSSLILLT